MRVLRMFFLSGLSSRNYWFRGWPRRHSRGERHAPAATARQRIDLKHVLVVGQTKGLNTTKFLLRWPEFTTWEESGLWDTMIRTDTELLTKKDLKRKVPKNLTHFDAVIFASTTGELDMDDSQKQDLMSFIKEDGKGFVGIHAVLDTNYNWPEYGDDRPVRPASVDDLQRTDYQ